jgi:hypothetical protein
MGAGVFVSKIDVGKGTHFAKRRCTCTATRRTQCAGTRLLQGAAAGAVAIMFVGFYWAGWSIGSTADKMAKERSDLAVVSALAPVCADKFRALPDADAKKVELSKVDSWKRPPVGQLGRARRPTGLGCDGFIRLCVQPAARLFR